MAIYRTVIVWALRILGIVFLAIALDRTQHALVLNRKTSEDLVGFKVMYLDSYAEPLITLALAECLSQLNRRAA
jgi:hypothetical protein